MPPRRSDSPSAGAIRQRRYRERARHHPKAVTMDEDKITAAPKLQTITTKPNGQLPAAIPISGPVTSADEVAQLLKAGIIDTATWADVNGALWDHLEATWFKPQPDPGPFP
jgi:hypothetical protein